MFRRGNIKIYGQPQYSKGGSWWHQSDTIFTEGYGLYGNYPSPKARVKKPFPSTKWIEKLLRKEQGV